MTFYQKSKWDIYWSIFSIYFLASLIARFFDFNIPYFKELIVVGLIVMLLIRLKEIYQIIWFKSKEQVLTEVPLPKVFLPTLWWLIYGLSLLHAVRGYEEFLIDMDWLFLIIFGVIEFVREYVGTRLILTPTRLIKLKNKIEFIDINDITQITKGEDYIGIDIEEEDYIELPSNIFKDNQRAAFLELLEKEGFPLLDEVEALKLSQGNDKSSE